MKMPELIDAIRMLVGSLPPGHPLPNRRKLCLRFDTNTFTFHNAISQLEYEGLVDIVPRKGVFVRKNSPVGSNYLRIIYLDHPQIKPVEEFGVVALISVAAKRKLEGRLSHILASDLENLKYMLQQELQNPACCGTVITGFVPEAVAEFLSSWQPPFVMLGEVSSERSWNQLPIVCGDSFQAGMLAGEQLIARGCDRLVLVHFHAEKDWSWLRYARAGVMEAVEKQDDVRVMVLKNEDLANARLFNLIDNWLVQDIKPRVGIACNDDYMLRIALTIREHLRLEPGDCPIALTGVELSSSSVAGIQKINCPVARIGQKVLNLVAALRRGADHRGRQVVPYDILPWEE